MKNTEQCYSYRETYKRQERVFQDLIKKPATVKIFLKFENNKLLFLNENRRKLRTHQIQNMCTFRRIQTTVYHWVDYLVLQPKVQQVI